ncbi:MAG TPA: galactokinase family protein [Bdellovibrionota bacterium]|nr:galactokinase family protein [Bdellovibrionota bacterium]
MDSRYFFVFTCFFASVAAWAGPEKTIPADPDHAPNPHFIRERMIDLNGPWMFGSGDDPARADRVQSLRHGPLDREIQVPFAPETPASGLNQPDFNSDVVWYERKVTIPKDWRGARIHFEGVDYSTEVYLDGKLLGAHQGGYDPFSFVLPSAPGEHVITVRVTDSRDSRSQMVGKQERTPNEGVIFYTNMIGIWKPVWVEEVPPVHLESFLIDADAQGGLTLHGELSRLALGARLRVRGRFEDETVVAFEAEAPVTDRRATLKAKVENPKLWSPEQPNLYFLEIEVIEGGQVTERVKSYTGFKTFVQGPNGYFELNSDPIRLNSALDQMIYPDSGYTPTEKDMLLDVKSVKEAGFNHTRNHQSTPTFRRLWLADRLGLAGSIELPSARDLRSPRAYAQYMREAQRIMKAYTWGRPGIFFFVGWNELWGHLEHHGHAAWVSDARHVEVQLDLYRRAVKLIPPRMPISVEDGWYLITSRMQGGAPTPGVDPSRMMYAIHDYAPYGEDLFSRYGSLESRPGEPMPTIGKPALVPGFEFPGPGAVPFLSEYGGRAFATREELAASVVPVMSYGDIFTEAEPYFDTTAGLMMASARSRYIRGGDVLTQVRAAQHSGMRGGELNGFLRANGTPIVPLERFRRVNEERTAIWRQGIGQGPVAQFAREARAFAPGRVEVLGNHLDYNGGKVIAMALRGPDGHLIGVNVRLVPNADPFDRTVTLVSYQKNSAGVEEAQTARYEIGKETKTGDWPDYFQGATALINDPKFREEFGLDFEFRRGYRLEIRSDLPLGGGLSSSGAIEVAHLRVLREAFGLNYWRFEDVKLARVAQAIENRFTGARSGLMDQLTISLSRNEPAVLIMDFSNPKEPKFEQIPIPADADLEYVIFHSGQEHKLSADHGDGFDFNTRVAETEDALKRLNAARRRPLPHLSALRAADLLEIRVLPENEQRRVRHVVGSGARVDTAVDALRRQDWKRFGELLFEEHASSRDLYQVTTPALDRIVDLAHEKPALAWGARNVGGGFGGVTLAAVRRGKSAEYAAWLEAQYEREMARMYPDPATRPRGQVLVGAGPNHSCRKAAQ